jgi:hypothetical protein
MFQSFRNGDCTPCDSSKERYQFEEPFIHRYDRHCVLLSCLNHAAISLCTVSASALASAVWISLSVLCLRFCHSVFFPPTGTPETGLWGEVQWIALQRAVGQSLPGHQGLPACTAVGKPAVGLGVSHGVTCDMIVCCSLSLAVPSQKRRTEPKWYDEIGKNCQGKTEVMECCE